MTTNRLTNIDSMRGIAALLVVWQHSSEKLYRIPEVAAHGTLLSDMASAVDFGRIGVVCFFLISGFVIPFSFSRGKGALGKFAIRRFFRLYPVYWLSIATALLAAYLTAGKAFDASTVAANITMLQTFFGQPHIQGLYWTLQAEVIFYTLCGALFALGLLDKPGYQIRACFALLALFTALVLAEENIPLFSGIPKELLYIPYVLAIMFSGTIIRTLLTGSVPNRQKRVLLSAPLAVFAVPLLVLVFHSVDIDLVAHPIKFGAAHLLGLAFFLVGFRLLRKPHASLLWLGTISYSIYLFHPVAMSLVSWMRVQAWAGGFDSLHMGVYMAVAAALTLMVAAVAYRVVEKPGIEVGYGLTR